MNPTWIEAHELPVEEKVYLKKDFIGWRVVEPWKNEDGSINKFNLLLGGKRNLLFLGFILLIMIFGYLAFHEGLSNYKNVIENPCAYCKTCVPGSVPNNLGYLNITLPGVGYLGKD